MHSIFTWAAFIICSQTMPLDALADQNLTKVLLHCTPNYHLHSWPPKAALKRSTTHSTTTWLRDSYCGGGGTWVYWKLELLSKRAALVDGGLSIKIDRRTDEQSVVVIGVNAEWRWDLVTRITAAAAISLGSGVKSLNDRSAVDLYCISRKAEKDVFMTNTV